jgi:hypothetical protein
MVAMPVFSSGQTGLQAAPTYAALGTPTSSMPPAAASSATRAASPPACGDAPGLGRRGGRRAARGTRARTRRWQAALGFW